MIPFWRNLEQRRGLQNSWHTTFDRRTAGYNSWEHGQDVDREVRAAPAQGILPSRLEPDAEDQPIQQRIATVDRWHETPRSSNFAKILPNNNVLNATLTGILSWSTAVVEETWNIRGVQLLSRTTTTSPQSLATLFKKSRGAKHGPSERQRMNYQAKTDAEKGSQKKHGNHPTILSRLYASETYRTSLSLIGCKEKHIMRNTSWEN